MEVEEKQRLIWLSGEAGLGVEREEENRALVVRSDLKCWILHDMQRYREQKTSRSGGTRMVGNMELEFLEHYCPLLLS